MAGSTSSSSADYFRTLAAVSSSIDHSAVEQYAQTLFDAWRRRARVFVFGNGGSAYNASHHVADYVKTASVPGLPRLHAFGLTDNVGLTTAIGNDLAYDQTFVFPLESYAQPGDVAVGISCSGNSPNLLRACEWARAHELTVVALTGFAGGQIKNIAHIHVNVPSDNYGVVEDLHMSIGHIAAQLLQARILLECCRV
jgi:D-sedoheptulose 7-phosphate isomerase